MTSPTPDCGKTVTALNLSLSVARQQDGPVALVDLDFRKPEVASCLGLKSRVSTVPDLLEGRTTFRNAIVFARAGNQRLWVLPSRPTKGSSELMSSAAMQDLLQSLKRECRIAVLDLPPVLSSDDVMCILPHIDCFLLVAAVGLTKTKEVEESMRHLDPSKLVRLIVNKDTAARPKYYYY